jgi:hypothetical protein
MLRDDRAEAPAPPPAEVHLTRIDVPFVELTAFFVKSSFALGLAFLLTSWLWVIVGTGVAALSAGLLVLAGVPGWFATEPPPTPVPVVAPAPPDPPPIVVLAPPVIEPAPTPAPVAAAEDPNRAATEAAQRAEIERVRRERAQRNQP